jgi:hypothetical protein
VLWVEGASGAWRGYDELARLDIRHLEQMSLTSPDPVHDQLIRCGKRDLVWAADGLPVTNTIKICFERRCAALAKPNCSDDRSQLSRLVCFLSKKRQSPGGDGDEKAPRPWGKEKRENIDRLVAPLMLGE